jgi:hypothetical protein
VATTAPDAPYAETLSHKGAHCSCAGRRLEPSCLSTQSVSSQARAAASPAVAR